MTQGAEDLEQAVRSGDPSRSISARATGDRLLQAIGTIGDERLSNEDILDLELNRARRSLAYLKRKIGNDGMRRLLDDDLQTMMAKVRGWVEASGGAWRTASLDLAVPGPGARAFQDWYEDMVGSGREAEMRAGHPEHFISHPMTGQVEVVENIGETELPWRVFYRALPEDFAYPSAWDASYTLHYGMELLDADGLRVGFSMRQSRDAEAGLQLRFTTHLPQAAPADLVQRHLHHFAIEFRNWTHMALQEREAAHLQGGKP